MKVKILRISLLVLAVMLSLSIAVPVFANEPSDNTTNMNVLIAVGSGTDIRVVGQTDTSLDANGVPVNNVMINGDGVVYQTDFNNTNALNASQITEYHNEIQNQTQIITQQANIISTQNQFLTAQNASIGQARAELEVVEMAIVKLINQSSLSSQDIFVLNEMSSKLVNDVTLLSSNYDSLHNDLLQTKALLDATNAQMSIILSNNDLLQDKIAVLEQDKYAREHSGFWHTLISFLGKFSSNLS